MKFEDLNLIGPLLKGLNRLDFSTPTQIQKEVIPDAIGGKDVLGLAKTGSGKTFAFGLPLLQNLYNSRLQKGYPDGKIEKKIKGLIIAPTRELAIQIHETLGGLASNTNMKIYPIYGGVNQFHQVKALGKGIDILVATPGRLIDLMDQGFIDLKYIEIFVLDEADKMLDMGFINDINIVLENIPSQRQTFLFSATMPNSIKILASNLLDEPLEVSIEDNDIPINIKEEVYHVDIEDKRKLLIHTLINNNFDSVIVFVRTKDETEVVKSYLEAENISCNHIHRNRSQNARQLAVKQLKNGDINVLVATDIASRGLDIDSLSCVINYDLPQEAETYVHRIGRTARAGKGGLAISFCTPKEKIRLEKIELLKNMKIQVNTTESYKNIKLNTIYSGSIFQMNEAETKVSSHSKKKRYYKKK